MLLNHFRIKAKLNYILAATAICLATLISFGCSSGGDDRPDNGIENNTTPLSNTLVNQAAYIPAECYAKTHDGDGNNYNSCYVCHTEGQKPNLTGDKDLQLEYAFPDVALTNHWTNLFKDRSAGIAAIDDAEITNYIRQNNYFDDDGSILLSTQLSEPNRVWDSNGNNHWDGYVPDCYFNFDDEGFDHSPQGVITGWRALAYYPFPSTHWPTNGSMSDVLIRLPEVFRTTDGVLDLTAYKVNLAILEALFKQKDIPIDEVDENVYGVDLNKDGDLSTASSVVYEWAPMENRHMSYVGDAKALQAQGDIHMAVNLYPKGTEFLNTLRYIDVDSTGDVVMAERFKEVRYALKTKWLTYAELENLMLDEIKERNDFPDRLRLPIGNFESGVSNGRGWSLRGFIENGQGDLRPQTFEELTNCIGCHGGVGVTADSTYAFPRKLDASSYQKGWFHWSQKSLKGINEPKIEIEKAGIHYEYSFYLMYNKGADAFRSNKEASAVFLDDKGMLKSEMAAKLHDDISLLLLPSAERAKALNKAYKLIVAEQSFTMGREPLLGAADNIHEKITAAEFETKVKDPVIQSVRATDWNYRTRAPMGGEALPHELQTAVDGVGMAGPDGKRYGVNWDGLIGISNYATEIKGAYFPFPRRHTLPTRMIVPIGNMSACYDCHRLPAAQPPTDSKLTLPVEMPTTEQDVSGGSMVRLTDHEAADINAEWHPDGTRIAWVSNRSGSYQIWVMRADGSEKTQITHGPAVHGWPRWSPDGTRLAFWGYDVASGNHYIYTCLADGSDRRTVALSTAPMDRPDWHPNSRSIAYGAVDNGNWDIYVAELTPDHVVTHRLTQGPEMETNPLWRPDGTAIAYKVAPSGDYNLTVQNMMTFEDGYASPTVHQWQSTQAIQMYDWHPDGRQISYTAEILTNASGEDRISYAAVVEDVTYASGNVTPGTRVILADRNTLGDRGPVFSPDGTQVAFWAWDKSHRATIWTVNTDGTNLRQITTHGFDMYPRWHPHGGSLLIESGRAGNMDLWVLSLSDDQ